MSCVSRSGCLATWAYRNLLFGLFGFSGKCFKLLDVCLVPQTRPGIPTDSLRFLHTVCLEDSLIQGLQMLAGKQLTSLCSVLYSILALIFSHWIKKNSNLCEQHAALQHPHRISACDLPRLLKFLASCPFPSQGFSSSRDPKQLKEKHLFFPVFSILS